MPRDGVVPAHATLSAAFETASVLVTALGHTTYACVDIAIRSIKSLLPVLQLENQVSTAESDRRSNDIQARR
jgi:hypothetical protein